MSTFLCQAFFMLFTWIPIRSLCFCRCSAGPLESPCHTLVVCPSSNLKMTFSSQNLALSRILKKNTLLGLVFLFLTFVKCSNVLFTCCISPVKGSCAGRLDLRVWNLNNTTSRRGTHQKVARLQGHIWWMHECINARFAGWVRSSKSTLTFTRVGCHKRASLHFPTSFLLSLYHMTTPLPSIPLWHHLLRSIYQILVDSRTTHTLQPPELWAK